MTRRLYYDDAYLTRFHARVVDVSGGGRELYLDQTAFYPASGGQPFDLGQINGVDVVDVSDADERIRHTLAQPLDSGEVDGVVAWTRRLDHMQQHSGQHLLSAVLIELFQIPTVSFHLSKDYSTIDLEAPSITAEQLRVAEQRANEVIYENRPILVSYEDSATAQGLRKESEREGVLRIVTIPDLDRSACGGTHVRSTAEIGAILIRKLDKIRGNVRLEFLCGGRAIRRARSDYDALSQIARQFSSALDETPELVAAQQAKLVEAERLGKRLGIELAQNRGRAAYYETQADEAGVKRLVREIAQGPIADDVRIEAQSFTAGSKSLFAALATDPPSLLLAVSEDLGMHAGNVLKAALTEAGGRGGGNARIAQGSLPSKQALTELSKKLLG